MNLYIIPANSKSGKLIFNIFRPFDLILASAGLVVSVLLILIISPGKLQGTIACLTPGLVCAFLVVPVPNYHNVLVVIQEAIRFFSNRRNYKWEGWSVKNDESE
jgi:hypothetical protein